MSSQTLPGSLKISVVDWAQSSRTLRQIRTSVFIEEQHVPEALEWDGLDTTCRQRSVKKIILNAQTYVLNFYQKAGFKISSDEFIDAGIMHKEMTLLL